jgi:DNA primase
MIATKGPDLTMGIGQNHSRVPRPRSNLGARLRPASRADHAARLLLSRMDLWDALTAEDHAMLCELPPPHGTLFVWLDHQFHDQGALPWGQLRDQLAGRDFEAKAQELMGDYLGRGGLPARPGANRARPRANCVA